MIIQELMFSGFKNAEQMRSYKFSNKVMISGDNRVGKSTIGEAICFLFFGCGLKGESKRLEDIINNNSDEAFVEGVYIDDIGASHTLTRRKNRRDPQRITLDGIDVSQGQINQIAGDADLFLSIFNPFYFNEVLKDKERRALIIEYSPVVNMMELFEEFAPLELIDKYEIVINKSAQEFTRLNKQRKEIEALIQGNRNQMVLLQGQNQEHIPEPMAIEQEKEDKLKDAVSGYNKLKAKADAYNEQIQMIQSSESSLRSKQAELNLVNESLTKMGEVKSIELDEEAQKQEKLRKRVMDAIRQLAKPAVREINELSECPLCAQSISDEHKQKVAEYNAAQLAEYNDKHQKLKDKEEKLADLVMKKNDAYEEWLNLDRYKKQLEKDISNLEQILANLPEKPDMQLLEKHKNIEDVYNTVVQANQKARTHNALVQQLKDQWQKRSDEIANINKNIENSNIILADLNLVCAALSPSTGISRKAVERKANLLKADLTHCEIILERQLKTTGDMEECFEINYDGKPYRRLSYSEQILCNLEIGKLLRIRSKRNPPLFLDNSESITNAPSEYITCDQIFMCRVEKNKELTAVNG